MDYGLTHDIDTRIRPLLTGNKCVAWIGSGLSKVLKYPSWKDAIDAMCGACGVPPVIPSHLKVGRFADVMMDTAQKCKQTNATAYAQVVHDLFVADTYSARSSVDYLVQLPFAGYITTNLDHSLERAVRRVAHGEPSAYAYPRLPIAFMFREPKPIYHIHGAASHDYSKPFVMSRAEYDDAYHSPALTSFLEQLLTEFDIVFVGCSLDEPDLEAVFERIHPLIKRLGGLSPSTVPSLGPSRQVIVPAKTLPVSKARGGRGPTISARDTRAEQDEDNRFAALGIGTIRYVADERHTAVDEIFEYLYRSNGGTTDYTIRAEYV